MKQSALAVLSWLAWTALALVAFDSLYYLLTASGLVTTPQPGSAAADGLTWLKVLGSPFIGNILIRRLAHAARRRLDAEASRVSWE